MHTIEQQAWQCLPEHAQQEVYDFFLFVKQRYRLSEIKFPLHLIIKFFIIQ